jgi:hypothetical protein
MLKARGCGSRTTLKGGTGEGASVAVALILGGANFAEARISAVVFGIMVVLVPVETAGNVIRWT